MYLQKAYARLKFSTTLIVYDSYVYHVENILKTTVLYRLLWHAYTDRLIVNIFMVYLPFYKNQWIAEPRMFLFVFDFQDEMFLSYYQNV